MGGTIALLAGQGHQVTLVDMTTGEPTPHGSEETRAKEAGAAAAVLGVTWLRIQAGFKNREVGATGGGATSGGGDLSEAAAGYFVSAVSA